MAGCGNTGNNRAAAVTASHACVCRINRSIWNTLIYIISLDMFSGVTRA